MEKLGLDKKTLFWDILFDFAGCFLFAVGIQCFSAPNDIAPGGVSGLSIILNYLTGLPIFLGSLFLNIPLLLLAWWLLGGRFTFNTVKTVGVMTLCLALCENYFPVYTGDMLLASLFGGVIQGIGLGLVFMRGSTTGGTDVASRLIQLKFPHVPVGRLILVVDGMVLLAAALVYRNLENALYGMITIFTLSRIIDSLLYGLDTGKVTMIMSDLYQEISSAVTEQMDRGCTLLQGKGGYTGSERPVLLCAVRKQEFYTLKRIVHQVDPDAFLVVLEANEIIGEGFKAPGTQR